jgi:hypothetical protein
VNNIANATPLTLENLRRFDEMQTESKKPEFVTLITNKDGDIVMSTNKGDSSISERMLRKYVNVINEGENINNKQEHDYILVLDEETVDLLNQAGIDPDNLN